MADTNALIVTVTKVDGPLFAGEVHFVTVPGAEGEMTVLKNHEPFISPLKKGTVTIETADGKRQTIEIEGGVLEVSGNQATLLV